MTTFTRLTFAAILVWASSWGYAAPPRVTGNRPIVIDAPLDDADEPDPLPPRSLVTAQTDAKPVAESDPASPRTAAAELKRARAAILEYSTIQAQVVETVTIFDRGYKAEGRYLQRGLKPNDWHMRMELALKVGNSEGMLLEVCDGDVLWTSTQVGAGRKSGRKEKREQSLVRRNVTQILEAARKHGEQTEARTISELGLGGIPSLLAAMEQDMTFGGMKDDTLRGHPVVVIQGSWSEAYAARFRNPRQQPSSLLLPPFVPDAVRISIDRETGFPHRIQYLKKLPDRDVQRAMLMLDFIDVALNQPIDNSEFDYEPPTGIQPVELTKYYVDRLEALTAPQAPGAQMP